MDWLPLGLVGHLASVAAVVVVLVASLVPFAVALAVAEDWEKELCQRVLVHLVGGQHRAPIPPAQEHFQERLPEPQTQPKPSAAAVASAAGAIDSGVVLPTDEVS